MEIALLMMLDPYVFLYFIHIGFYVIYVFLDYVDS